jgi:hypothetical protein
MALEEIGPSSEICNVAIRAWQEDAIRLAAQHSPHNLLCNGLRMKSIVQKVPLVEPLEQRRTRVPLSNTNSSYFGGIKDGSKLSLDKVRISHGWLA